MNEKDTKKKTEPNLNDHVAMIEDPYGIRTIEIHEAQQISTELDLDEDFDDLPETEIGHAGPADSSPERLDLAASEWKPAEDAGQLENLERAMAEEASKFEELAKEANVASEEESARYLAAQIAEDQALAAQLAKEALEAEKALEMDPELLAALPKEPQADENGNLDLSELQSCIETLLFMVDKPVSAKRLQEWLGPQFKDELFLEALEALKTRYQAMSHGIELVEIAGGWQLRTKPGRAALAKRLSKIQTQRLSSGGMETLAICAYRQPVMKEDIDKIRGVDSSYFVRGLLEKKLIAITGRSELPGRPMLYSTTDHFLELFGLKDLAALPSLREIEQMVPSSQSNNPEDEDPRVKEMRRLVGKMTADTSTSLLYDPGEDEKILKEIRERVGAIQTSTPYLDEQKAAEKAAKEAAKNGGSAPLGTQFDLANATPEMADMPPPADLDEPESSTDSL